MPTIDIPLQVTLVLLVGIGFGLAWSELTAKIERRRAQRERAKLDPYSAHLLRSTAQGLGKGYADIARTYGHAEPTPAEARQALARFREDHPEIVAAWDEEQERLVAAARVSMCHDPCHTVQHSDQVECETCRRCWDVNDPCPPECPYH